MKFLIFLHHSKTYYYNIASLSTLSVVKKKVPNLKSLNSIGQKTEKNDIKINKDIIKYFNVDGKSDILEIFPHKILKKKMRTPESFYVSDHVTAKYIAEYLQKDFANNIPIIEINPGPGFVTRELIKTDIKDIKLFESTEHFLPSLTNIQEEHSDRIQLKKGDFISLWKLAYQDKIDNGTRIREFLSDIPIFEWSDAPNSRIFACVGSINFFKHLINSVIFQTSLYTYGRSEMYLVLPPPLYIHLTCSNDAGYLLYRATTILFQILFEHEFLTKLERKHFLPWQNDYNLSKTNKLSKVNSIDPDCMYFVRIIPRKNLYQLCSHDNLLSLWYFIKQNCVSRKNRIIPTLEKWIPGCGPRLIINTEKTIKVKPLIIKEFNLSNNPLLSVHCTTMSTKDFYKTINIFTQFGDLNPSQLLTLFTTFKSWPEYMQSPFLESMKNYLLKMETSIDETETAGLIEMPDEDDSEVNTNKLNKKKEHIRKS